MGLKDRLADLKEDIEWKNNEKKESKMIRKLFKTYKPNDFAMNILHMDLDMLDMDVLFAFDRDGHSVMGNISCMMPFKEDIEAGYEGEFHFHACIPLPEHSQWPKECNLKEYNERGMFMSMKDAGFDNEAHYYFNKELSNGKKTTKTVTAKAFCVQKSFPLKIADSSDESNRAMDEFFEFFDQSVSEYKDILDPLLG